MNEFYLESLNEPAITVMRDVCGVKSGERVLIVTNPEKNVLSISMALYEASVELGAEATIMVQEEKTLLTYAVNDKDGKLAITNYEPIISSKSYSVVKINIETGRKNQIRVAMNSIKHPIVGDKKYGSVKNPVRRVCLHASKLEITHPIKNVLMTFEAKLPKEYKQFMEQ